MPLVWEATRGGASGHGPSRPFRARRTARERTPSARRRSAITTRPQPCRESNTCSHKAGGSERHGRGGARTWTLKREASDEARRPVAPHLPKAGLFTPNAVRETPVLKSGGVHHLAVGAGMLLEPACLSGRWCQAGGAVEDRAAQGGADGCAQVRGRAQPRV